MKIPQNPFNDALQTCLNNIEEFKKRVEKESELKNSLLSQMANFYTDNFQNTYFKEEKTKSRPRFDDATCSRWTDSCEVSENDYGLCRYYRSALLVEGV